MVGDLNASPPYCSQQRGVERLRNPNIQRANRADISMSSFKTIYESLMITKIDRWDFPNLSTQVWFDKYARMGEWDNLVIFGVEKSLAEFEAHAREVPAIATAIENGGVPMVGEVVIHLSREIDWRKSIEELIILTLKNFGITTKKKKCKLIPFSVDLVTTNRSVCREALCAFAVEGYRFLKDEETS